MLTEGYYNRFDAGDHYEQHLFRAGRVLQSAELNELQSASRSRLQMLGDSLFKDGDVVRDARVVVNPATGHTVCESGAVYIRGEVRGVPSATITIPVDRTVAVGITLREQVITELDDPGLLDPATESPAYNEPGAARLRVMPEWSFDDGVFNGNFFPIYYVDNGHLRAKEAPPAMDSINQALARYDRDSAGSNYIVSGLRVSQFEDLPSGEQVYGVQEGRARVNGFGVTQSSSRRLTYAATPDLRSIDSEPYVSSTAGSQRVNLARFPIGVVNGVRVTLEKTESIIHGSFSGVQDPLPETSVVDIIEVKQGGTTYVKGVDYKLTSGRVDWSLSGAEPAPGSTYTAKFQHIGAITPTEIDDTGFTISGAVVGTLVLTSYTVKLPRIDRLCLTEGGEFVWFKGVSTDYDPVRPSVPVNIAPVAQIHQTWMSTRRVVNDGVRVVPMSDIEAMNSRMDVMTDLIAQQKLISDLSVREQSARKGLFVDPFLDDSHRDQGVTQTAAIVDGILMLPISGESQRLSNDVSGVTVCAHNLARSIIQESRTGVMKINPYMAFGVSPAIVTLDPSVDRWVETVQQWTSPETRQFTFSTTESLGLALQVINSTSTSVMLVKSETSALSHLRQIDVKFRLEGFGPGEELTSVKFDGLAVNPAAI